MGIPLGPENNHFRLLPQEYRLLPQRKNVDFVNGNFGAHVLKDAFVNLRIAEEAEAADGSAVARFLKTLNNRHNIFVDAF